MFAYSRGVNPCAIVRKSKHESEENIMNKGDKIEVNDKDVISLLPSGIYPMTFSIPESKTNIAKRNLDPDFSTPIPNKKPRLEVIQNEEDEKNKPMCKYGISCYQTNAEHRKKYRHGAAFDEDKNGVDNFKSKKREGSESEDDIFGKNKKIVGQDDDDEDGKFAIAFPSISTSTYQFDAGKAAVVGCRVITEFLGKFKNPKIKIILVDISESEALKAFRKVRMFQIFVISIQKFKIMHQNYKLDDERFVIKVGNIVQMKSRSHLQCRYVMNLQKNILRFVTLKFLRPPTKALS